MAKGSRDAAEHAARLEQWDLPQTSLAAPMQWMSGADYGIGSMGHAGSATATPDRVDAVMPGVATDEELQPPDAAALDLVEVEDDAREGGSADR